MKCYCKINEDEIISCYHHGEGLFQCPECGGIQDCSEVVFIVTITYKKDEDGCVLLELETEDERLLKPQDPRNPDRTDLTAMKEDLYDGIPWDDELISNHEEGTFKTEIWWNWYLSDWETNEHDLEMYILEEERIDAPNPTSVGACSC